MLDELESREQARVVSESKFNQVAMQCIGVSVCQGNDGSRRRSNITVAHLLTTDDQHESRDKLSTRGVRLLQVKCGSPPMHFTQASC
jgi:hypothetical protein